MTDSDIPVFFFIRPDLMPKDVDRFLIHKDFHLEGSGVLNWTLQAFLGLRTAGFSCQLVSEVPDRGIIIAHKDCLPLSLKPNTRQLFVCIKPDRSLHPYAQVHVVQNPNDDMLRFSFLFHRIYFVNHFPQSHLIPRNPERGAQVENVSYTGNPHELDESFKTREWQDELKSLDVNWVIKPAGQWHDYSDVDIVFAVRRLRGKRHYRKPASKLVNSWRAGVPAVLGSESACRSLRRSDVDYIEVRDREEALAAIRRLKNDSTLFSAMVSNGQKRARDHSEAKVVDEWKNLINNELQQDFRWWTNAPPWIRLWNSLRGNMILWMIRQRLSDHGLGHFLRHASTPRA